jgi:hypothetical protein
MFVKKAKGTPSIGAFYQCYKQPKAFLHTLQSFRKVYPESTVVIMSDGGFNYRKEAEHFGCIYRSLEHQETIAPGLIFDSGERIVEWMRRLAESARLIAEDYIMLLENDVWVMKPATRLNYDLNGINKKTKIGPELTNFLKTRNTHIPPTTRNYYYGGCGGTIVKKSFILNHLGDLEKIRLAVREIHSFSEGIHIARYASDYYLSNAILYYGGAIGPYAGFCETFYLSYWLRKRVLGNIETLHQYKELYD